MKGTLLRIATVLGVIAASALNAPSASAGANPNGCPTDKPLVVGKKTPFEWVDQANKKQRASGEVTLLDVAAGIAKLASKWEIRGGASGKSLKIDMTSFVEVSTGKLVKAVGSIVEPPSKDADRKSTRFSTERDASHS